MKNFYDKISHILEEILEKNFKVQLEPPLWEVPQRQEFGDLSTMVALKLSSRLKQEALEVAHRPGSGVLQRVTTRASLPSSFSSCRALRAPSASAAPAVPAVLVLLVAARRWKGRDICVLVCVCGWWW